MKVVETIMVLGYCVLVIGIGVYYYRRASQSKEEYFMAGRSFTTFAAAFALFAAVASGSSMVGGVGLGWRDGLPFYLAYGLGAISLFPFALFLFAAQMRRTGATTLPEFFEKRYGSAVSLVGSVLVVFFMGLYLIPQLRASGILGQYVLGIPYEWSVAIVAVAFIVYSSLGGMWAVTITSLIQGIMMVVASVIMAGTIFLAASGNLSELFAKAVQTSPHFGSVNLPWMSYFGIFFIFIWFAIVAPSAIMRNLASKNANVARRAMAWATLFYVVLWIGGLMVLTAGAGLFAKGSLANPDYVYFQVVGAYLPPILGGLVLAAIMAAIMSSTDAFLLAVSGGVAYDIYSKYINPNASEKQVVRIGLITMWVVGILALIAALNPPQIITIMVAWVSGGMVAGFAFPILLGIWWERANKEGALAGMVIGTVLYIALVLAKPFPLVSEVLVAAPVSAVVMIVVSLLTPAPSTSIVEMVRQQHRALRGYS